MHRNMNVVIYLCARYIYLTDKCKEYFIIHFLWKKWSKSHRNRRCGARAEGKSCLHYAEPRGGKLLLMRNLRGRHLSSVKRMLRTFEAIKRSPFLNPPTACRPISPNFAVRDRLTHGNINPLGLQPLPLKQGESFLL